MNPPLAAQMSMYPAEMNRSSQAHFGLTESLAEIRPQL
jgi:hypothetical protein